MTTIEAIYENGVFRPLKKIDLPEHAHMQLAVTQWPIIEAGHAQAKVWEVLSRRFEGDDPQIAERA